MASRATKSTHVGMTMYDAVVTQVRDLTPHLRRVTFAGDALRAYADDGPDQRFKLLLPRAGQAAPILPPGDATWYQSWLAMDPATRPIMRTYTIRSARPELGEVDVDMLVHGDTGPGSAWATRAIAGDRVGMFGSYAEYEVVPGERQLIAGDHCALPAVAAIVDRFDDTTSAHVVVEVPASEERVPLPSYPHVTAEWVDTVPGRPGAALTHAVAALEPREFDYAWVAADSLTVRTIRRHLVRERGMATDRVMFMGYWRTDGAIDDLLPADEDD